MLTLLEIKETLLHPVNAHFMSTYCGQFDNECWHLASLNQPLPDWAIIQGAKLFDDDTWLCVSASSPIPKSVINLYGDEFRLNVWWNVTKHSLLSKFAIKSYCKFFDIICWENITAKQPLESKIVLKYCSKFSNACWYNLTWTVKFSYNFILAYYTHFDEKTWLSLFINSEYLDIKMLKFVWDKFPVKLWHHITKEYELDDTLLSQIITFFDTQCWENITRFQRLTSAFINKYEFMLSSTVCKENIKKYQYTFNNVYLTSVSVCDVTDKCSICREDSGSNWVKTACDHVYHLPCINSWFDSSSTRANMWLPKPTATCPLCRTEL